MKWLVLGATGQLGTDLVNVLQREGEPYVAATRQHADLSDPVEIDALLTAERPDAVIDCAAYHDVAGCEANPGLATAINTTAVATSLRPAAGSARS